MGMDNHNKEWLLNLRKTKINASECCCLLGAIKSIEKLLQVTLTQNAFRHDVKSDIAHNDNDIARGCKCAHHECSV